jgi:hypothetical protein
VRVRVGGLRPVAGSPVTVIAGPGSWPGSVDQEPAESAEARHCERHGHRIGAHELLR